LEKNNVKAQMPKGTEEEWNDGTSECWFGKYLGSSHPIPLFQFSIIPHNYPFGI
jgi:hypothetical protein